MLTPPSTANIFAWLNIALSVVASGNIFYSILPKNRTHKNLGVLFLSLIQKMIDVALLLYSYGFLSTTAYSIVACIGGNIMAVSFFILLLKLAKIFYTTDNSMRLWYYANITCIILGVATSISSLIWRNIPIPESDFALSENVYLKISNTSYAVTILGITSSYNYMLYPLFTHLENPQIVAVGKW